MPRLSLRLGAALLLAIAGCAADEAAPAPERLAHAREAIINGTLSTADQDDVVLVAWQMQGQEFPSCSGELVAKNLVLTAHHCIGNLDEQTGIVTRLRPADLHIYAGADAPRRVGAGRPAAVGTQILTVDDKQLTPDLAFIVLDRDVSAPIAPIRIAGGATIGEGLTIVGFGITESGQLPTARRQRTGISVIDVGPGPVTGDTLNDGEFTFGEAACSGDSGGPALSAKTKAVVGVASRVGNGKPRTDADPSAFCVGANTQDIYTALTAAPQLVEQAFAAAGASPTLEPKNAPAPPKPAPTTDKPPPTADETPPDPRPVTTTTTTSSGCSASRGPADGPPWTSAALALAVASLAGRGRKRRR